MGFFDIFKKPEPPKTTLQAIPVEINGHPDAVRQRIVNRLLNLYRVKQPTQGVLDEIERYKQAVEAQGLEVPTDLYECEILLNKVRI